MNPTALASAPTVPPHPRGRGRPRTELAHLSAIEHPAPAFRAAMDEVRPSLHDLADALGIVPRTLTSYYSGTRGVPERVQRLTAIYLRAHAAHLEQLAAAIDAALEAPHSSSD